MNEIWEKVYKAYIFSFPLMMMDATMRVSTNTAEPDDSGKAPANRWMHAKHLASASFRQVVTPNVDTLYSQDEPEGHKVKLASSFGRRVPSVPADIPSGGFGIRRQLGSAVH